MNGDLLLKGEVRGVEAVHGVVSDLTANRFGYQGWPSVAKLENGMLLTGASAFRLGHICPFGKTALYYSPDGGSSWSPPVIVNDTPLDDRDVGLLHLGGQSLLLSWFNLETHYFLQRYRDYLKEAMPSGDYALTQQMIESYTPELNQREAGSFVRVSRDGGLTWGAASRVPVTAPHGPTLLADGNLLYMGKGYAQKEENDVIAVYGSKDNGGTWQHISTLPPPPGTENRNFFEPHMIQQTDGSLLAHVRFQDSKGVTPFTPHFSIFQTRSTDGGETWEPLTFLGVNGSPPHLLYHSSGTLISAFGRREAPFGQRAILSRDNGATWREVVLRDDAPDSDLGYPCSVELDGGELLTVYYQKRTGVDKPAILYTRWTLPD